MKRKDLGITPHTATSGTDATNLVYGLIGFAFHFLIEVKVKTNKGCDFYLWEEDYVQYLKDKHGNRSKIGEEGGATRVAGLLGGRRQQEAMCTTAVEDEIGLLGFAVNKEDLTSIVALSIAQEICIVLKALLGVRVWSMCHGCCNHKVNIIYLVISVNEV